MPEWYLLVLILFAFSILGVFWRPLLIVFPFLLLALILPLIQAARSSKEAIFSVRRNSFIEQLKIRTLTTYLHLVQPMARLWGRIRTSVFVRRQNRRMEFSIPIVRTSKYWSENWIAPEQRLETVEKSLQSENAVVLRGGDYDRWDLEVRGGLLSSVRTFMAVEDHGSGNQLIRFRSWPRIENLSIILITLLSILAILAANDQAWIVASLLGIAAIILTIRMVWNCSTAMASLLNAIGQVGGEKVS